MILQVKVYPTGNTPVTEIAPMDGLRWEMPAIWLGVRLSRWNMLPSPVE